MYEIPVHTGILTGRNRNVENICQNLTCMFKIHLNKRFLNRTNLWEIISGKFRPESGTIQYPVPEPKQGFE